jgi:hypothetical protein
VASGGVGGRVVLTEIGFGFDNASGQNSGWRFSYQQFSE